MNGENSVRKFWGLEAVHPTLIRLDSYWDGAAFQDVADEIGRVDA